ncbi:ATP synthase mitochondrial F1 complex assembly factor 1 [Acyrthosiphon pisum]|uniref:ACYPI003555 protein n=1 Tax=Acyrthosiphon pisum TaxID=7029 RepID=C4WY42_ACYPI|nr:ATP synthase mitochondrial F1 complex assembly factor 1 [Acyrthosiphon pisum]BAH72812.1 ACYPI003555 [Acyrthosiphon pisum]|eukprot:NP_001280347.1 ATP synthase mitochondrial F1 complex assembly factor 1 [Acyrthosiphon pisum]
MLMALNRHMLHNSLLKFQQHLATSSNTLKVVASNVANNNGLTQTNRSSSSFRQQSSSSDSEGEETLKNNPYYTAYAEKLGDLKKKNASAYREALRRLREKQQETIDTVDASVVNATDTKSDKINSTETKPQAKPKRRPSQTLLVKPKTLEQVMNIELLRDKSWRDVSEIWLAYHRTRDETLSAVIPLNQFEEFYNQSIKYPMFLLPLPRNTSGYEFIFAQFQHYQENSMSNCTVHLTPLISYQTFNENAPECMTIKYYTDLCNNDKTIEHSGSDDESCVLMRSTYDGKLLSAAEAACLVNQLRIFYAVDSGVAEKEKLLKSFNEGDVTFKHSDVIALVETLSI